MLDTIVRDARHSWQLLAKSPAFTGVAVLTLALGIGANAAIFGLFDAVMLRPLPYSEADRLVSIWETAVGPPPLVSTSSGRPVGSSPAESPELTREVVAPANFVDYRQRATSFAGMAAFASVGRNLTGDGPPERVLGEAVTHDYFEVLGVAPALGRGIGPEEDRPGANRVVVISYGLWHRRLGGDPLVLGRRLRLDGEEHEVVGVMPADFEPLTQFGLAANVSFWIPAAFPPELLANHGDHEVNVVARLAPRVSVASAADELGSISAALAAQYPDTNAGIRAMVTPAQTDLVRHVSRSLVVLLSAAGVILLIACVNVANLLLVRAVARRREVALRMALGAGRGRIVAELMTQSALLGTLGCAVGIGLGYGIERILTAMAPQTIPRLDAVSLDGRVLAFAILLSMLTSVLFGLAPAWHLLTSNALDVLKTDRVVAGGAVLRWRRGLMVAEVTLSTVLLVGAGLMVTSLVALNKVDLGFQTDHVLAMGINLAESRYGTAEQRLAFFESLQSRVASLPGVRSVAFANRLPLRGGWSGGFTLEPSSGSPGQPPALEADLQAVSPEYFRTLGIALLRGRLLTPDDRQGTMPVAVVTESFVRRFLGGQDALGRRLRRHEQAPWITIVGVVTDVRRGGKAAALEPQVYLSAAQTSVYPVRLADLAVRTDGDPRAMTAAIQAEVWRLDSEQPVTNVRTLDEVLSERAAERRFQTLLFALFAALALTLAVVGIYGVVSYAVSQRTGEIGVRMALGADGATILRWILGEATRWVGIGALAGVAGAAALSRALTSLLFGITPTDPATYAAAAGSLALVALIASYLAARRSTLIDPVAALRSE